MEDIWVYVEDWNGRMELYDCEETARLAYRKWCELHNETFDEDIFNRCYHSLSAVIATKGLITAEEVASKDYIPA